MMHTVNDKLQALLIDAVANQEPFFAERSILYGGGGMNAATVNPQD